MNLNLIVYKRKIIPQILVVGLRRRSPPRIFFEGRDSSCSSLYEYSPSHSPPLPHSTSSHRGASLYKVAPQPKRNRHHDSRHCSIERFHHLRKTILQSPDSNQLSHNGRQRKPQCACRGCRGHGEGGHILNIEYNERLTCSRPTREITLLTSKRPLRLLGPSSSSLRPTPLLFLRVSTLTLNSSLPASLWRRFTRRTPNGSVLFLMPT